MLGSGLHFLNSTVGSRALPLDVPLRERREGEGVLSRRKILSLESIILIPLPNQSVGKSSEGETLVPSLHELTRQLFCQEQNRIRHGVHRGRADTADTQQLSLAATKPLQETIVARKNVGEEGLVRVSLGDDEDEGLTPGFNYSVIRRGGISGTADKSPG